MQMTKNRFVKKKTNRKEATHMEGKHFCDCRIRNFRKWLGVKLYGQPERTNPEDAILESYYGNKFCGRCKEENCICDVPTSANR